SQPAAHRNRPHLPTRRSSDLSEEKHFVRHLSNMMDDLRSKYEEVYLVRNERFAQLAVYDFHTGERFEPDFLLFLREKNGDSFRQDRKSTRLNSSHVSISYAVF